MNRRVLLLVVLAACPKGSDHKPPAEPPGKGDASRLLPAVDDGSFAIVLPPAPPVPARPAGLPPLPDSPALAVVTPDAVALGELLFFEPRLASDGKTTCASCHDPAHGYAGGTDKTAAGQPNLRRTPTIVNLAWQKELGWDGRYRSLDELMPAHIRGQLGAPLETSLAVIADNPIYRAHLARVGGRDAALHALEAYVLTRYAGDAPWDRSEPNARAPQPDQTIDPIVAGYLVFTGKGQCAVCHPPPLYTDFGYHRIEHNTVEDAGRAKVDPALANAFKTPTLRGAAARTVFFHTGAKTSLSAVIDWYAIVGTSDPTQVDPALAKIKLAPVDRANLLAFLEALTGPTTAPVKPVLP